MSESKSTDRRKTRARVAIDIAGQDRCLDGRLGETLLDALRRAHWPVDAACDGDGVCGRCRIRAQGELSTPEAAERRLLAGAPPGFRLACQTRVRGPATVWPEIADVRLQRVPPAMVPQARGNSLVRRVPLPALEPENALPYAETLPFRCTDPKLLHRLSGWARADAKAWGVVFDDELIAVDTLDRALLGAAVDIGTTGIALNLCDLGSGRILETVSGFNPQIAYGADVIARMAYCQAHEDGPEVLRAVLLRGLTTLFNKALGDRYHRDQVGLVTVAGNATMLHLLAGVDPTPMARLPFRPVFRHRLTLTGRSLELPIHPQGRVVLLPGVSAYVGADIVAGLDALGSAGPQSIRLFMDIGTNGEIVLMDEDRLFATSCAVGPALEGMNIECGCRAVPGAVDRFCLNEDFQPHFGTIGDRPPTGICGSGLIALTAALVRSGLIAASGAFDPAADSRLRDRLRHRRYYLTESLYLSQKDVRQVQLAKGAVRTGLELLLAGAGISMAAVSEIVVAGAFGFHLDPKALKTLGMLPETTACPVRFVGNSSLAGAIGALLDRGALDRMEQIQRRCRVINLGAHSEFQDRFVASLDFPRDREDKL